MTLPKTILVPTDFGDVSEAALDTALDYARVFGAEVVLLHAYEIPVIGFPDGAVVATADLTSRILEGAQVGLDRQIQSRQGSGVTIRAIIKQGNAWQMVNETVDEIGAGLIIMGTHGRHGIPRILIGSVTEKVVRTAKVPVLTVHVGDKGRAASQPSPVSPVASREKKPEEQRQQEQATVLNGRDQSAPSHR